MATSYVDKRDAARLTKAIFSKSPGESDPANGKDVLSTEIPTVEADAAPPDDYASPEADRLFPRPTPEEAEHNLRDLTWGEHIVATRMAAARGNSTAYLYGLQEAAIFFLDGNSGGVTLGSSGSFAWVDLDRFVAWIRDTVGDEPFAAVLEEKLGALDAYNDKIETMRQLLDLRMTQYIPYLPADEEDDAGEDGASGADEGAVAGESARE